MSPRGRSHPNPKVVVVENFQGIFHKAKEMENVGTVPSIKPTAKATWKGIYSLPIIHMFLGALLFSLQKEGKII